MKIKFLLSFLFFAFFSLNLFAQGWLWAKSAGGNNYDYGFSVNTDLSGNVYATGTFGSSTITFGGFTLTSAGGGGDIYLVKYDPSGNVVWAKSAGGTGDDEGYSVNADKFGNVYVTGTFFSPTITFGTFNLINTGGRNVYLAKYDSSGNVIWATSAQGNGNDDGRCVTTDASGNIYVTGYFNSSTITFGSIALINSGTYWDMFIVKYDALGNALWGHSAGGPNDNEYGWSVSTDASGNVYAAGRTDSPTITFGSFALINPGASNGYLVKYDTSGTVLWAKSIGGNDADETESVTTDGSGNIYITGMFASPSITLGTFTLINSGGGGYDMFLAKYDPSGNVLWAKSAGATGFNDEGFSVSADVSGNVYVSGLFQSPAIHFGSITLTGGTGDPIFIAKYDSNGNVLCANALASGGYYLYAINTDLFGNMYTTGSFSVNPFPIGSSTLYLAGGGATDVFVAKYVCCSIVPTITGTTTIIQGQNTTLNASGGNNYLWSNNDTNSTIVVQPTTTTVYCVIVSNSNFCTDTACVKVFVESPCDTANAFFFPNAFSPNDDGDNDVLKIYYKTDCIKEFKLIIYNRWGEIIFETTDPDFKWNGTYKSTLQNTAVFDYYLKAILISGKEISKKGNISLVR